MANDLSSNPYIIDTASATAIRSDFLYVQAFEWDQFVNGADQVQVANAAGAIVWQSQGNNEGQAIWFAPGNDLTIKGLKVPTLTNGKLKVYLS